MLEFSSQEWSTETGLSPSAVLIQAHLLLLKFVGLDLEQWVDSPCSALQGVVNEPSTKYRVSLGQNSLYHAEAVLDDSSCGPVSLSCLWIKLKDSLKQNQGSFLVSSAWEYQHIPDKASISLIIIRIRNCWFIYHSSGIISGNSFFIPAVKILEGVDDHSPIIRALKFVPNGTPHDGTCINVLSS